MPLPRDAPAGTINNRLVHFRNTAPRSATCVARGCPALYVLANDKCRAGLQWLAPKAERGTDRCGPY